MQKLFILGLWLLTLTAQARAFNPEGIYVGTMSIKDQGEYEIPLQLSLTMTGEMEIVDGAERQIIDSAFLVDDEGGPYGFSNVRLNLESNILELTYLRPQVSNIANTPSFQLKGRFNDNNELTGDVFSGRNGLIGTFKLAKSDQKMLQVTRKYTGRWKGRMIYQPEEVAVEFQITMAESFVPNTNPTDYEFEYTRGKASGYQVGEFPESFQYTYIDYLHRKVHMILIGLDGDTNVSLEMSLDEDKKSATGTFNSIFGGQRGSFNVKKVEEVTK